MQQLSAQRSTFNVEQTDPIPLSPLLSNHVLTPASTPLTFNDQPYRLLFLKHTGPASRPLDFGQQRDEPREVAEEGVGMTGSGKSHQGQLLLSIRYVSAPETGASLPLKPSLDYCVDPEAHRDHLSLICVSYMYLFLEHDWC